MAGRRCRQCRASYNSKTFTLTHEDYCTAVKKTHGNKISVLGRYRNGKIKIKHQCNACGNIWKGTPQSIKNGIGCPVCANNQARTKDQIEKALRAKHPTLRVEEHVGANHPIKIKCTKCKGSWTAGSTYWLLNKSSGCPTCNKYHLVSRLGTTVMSLLENKLRLKIQHSENVGEFQIPNTRFKVDGYNKRFNIVFEFYGDYWHRTKDATALTRTKRRERLIRKLGYSVVVIWETTWLENSKAELNRIRKEVDLIKLKSTSR